MNLALQQCVVDLYGPNRTQALYSLAEHQEICNEDSVRHAVSYNVYYGDPDAKIAALEIAGQMNILSKGEIADLTANS